MFMLHFKPIVNLSSVCRSRHEHLQSKRIYERNAHTSSFFVYLPLLAEPRDPMLLLTTNGPSGHLPSCEHSSVRGGFGVLRSWDTSEKGPGTVFSDNESDFQTYFHRRGPS